MVLYPVIDQFLSSQRAQKAYFLSGDFVWLSLCFLLVRTGHWRAHLCGGPTTHLRGSLARDAFGESGVLSGPQRRTLGRNHPPPCGGPAGGCAGTRAPPGATCSCRGPDGGYSPAGHAPVTALPVAREQPQAEGWRGRAPLKRCGHRHLNFRYFSYITE